MTSISLADVGDGFCALVASARSPALLIDCGSAFADQGPAGATRGLRRIHDRNVGCIALSHLHADHYNGFMNLAYPRHAPTQMFRADQLVVPRLPDRPVVRDFSAALFAMNEVILGRRTGVMEHDFVEAIRRLNATSFTLIPASAGESFAVGSATYDVLWPPRSLADETPALTSMARARSAFFDAIEELPALGDLFERVRSERLIESLASEECRLEASESEADVARRELTKPSGYADREDDVQWEIPPAVARANAELRSAANHLSLVLVSDGGVVVFGDATRGIVNRIVGQLERSLRTEQLAIFAPHHGSQFATNLKRMRAFACLAANGRHLGPGWRNELRVISPLCLSTYAHGDIHLCEDRDCFHRHMHGTYMHPRGERAIHIAAPHFVAPI